LVDTAYLSECSLSRCGSPGTHLLKEENEGTCLILLGTRKATSGVLCPVSWPSVQEGCGETGEGPAIVSQDGRGPGAPERGCGRWAYVVW